MNEFEDRERAFENKFEHDEELQFKINARMAHLFGLWVADQLGLKGADAEKYAEEAVSVEVAGLDRKALIAKTEKDLAAKNISLSRHRLEREMEGFYAAAREKVAGKG